MPSGRLVVGAATIAPVGYDSWRHLRDLVDWVAGNWGREDEGVWEVRGGRRHFVLSLIHISEPTRPY